MKNFPVQVNGKEQWISRSLATCGIIFTEDEGLRVLTGKRGKGCPDENGKWCCPGGYLDYDERIIQACCREIKEETNLSTSPSLLNFYDIDDDPKSPHQNITVFYWSYRDTYAYQTVYPEPEEVDDVEWIHIEELDKYEWAFDHKYIIMRVALEKLRDKLSEETIRRFEKELKERDFLLNHAKS